MSIKYENFKVISDERHCVAPFESGLNRREFLQHLLRQSSGTAALLAGLMISRPSVAMGLLNDDTGKTAADKFTGQQKAVLEAVQLQLFPADGDGPSAAEINALPYLEWALTDPGNIEDGDRAFLIKGIGWLQDFSKETLNKSFTRLSNKQQHQLLEQFSKSSRHENWMSLLVYYLLEALLLDPVYGGNPDGVGWKWLEHQPGFPRPGKGQTYRHLLT